MANWEGNKVLLKSIFLNGKKIPVPIPIKSMFDTVRWLESHMLRPEHTITKIVLDKKEIEPSQWIESKLNEMRLNKSSILEIQVDSPGEISIQSLDALRNLATVMERSLKPIAVECWQWSKDSDPVDFESLYSDVDLILDLMDHVMLLLDQRVSIANFQIIYDKISSASSCIQLAREEKNWKGAAKLILQQLESGIMEMNVEISMLEKSVFEVMADRSHPVKPRIEVEL